MPVCRRRSWRMLIASQGQRRLSTLLEQMRAQGLPDAMQLGDKLCVVEQLSGDALTPRQGLQVGAADGRQCRAVRAAWVTRDFASRRLSASLTLRTSFTPWSADASHRPPFARALGYVMVQSDFAEWLRAQDDAADRALGSRVGRMVVVKPEDAD